jgi:alpha-methylacyl-CoA racemase
MRYGKALLSTIPSSGSTTGSSSVATAEYEVAPGAGPLTGLRVVELAGIGPAPHAAMWLADMGADVIRVERPDPLSSELVRPADQLLRARRVLTADLKSAPGRQAVLELIGAADVLIDPFRPGVAERLGVGPQTCAERNGRLIYARMTGWGQTGPLAGHAGHDINYISLTGVLHAIGTRETPTPPLNLVGDFGGGSMLLLSGILAALWERERSGTGQTVDVAMIDGASLLLQDHWGQYSRGRLDSRRQANMLDGGAPYYRTYRCGDGRFVAVGAIEPQFYAALLTGLELHEGDLPDRDDHDRWPELATIFETRFAERPRDDWAAVFADTDACVTPVLALDEVLTHPHISARRTIVVVGGLPQAAPAPRFSRSVVNGGSTTQRQGTVTLAEMVEAWAQPVPKASVERHGAQRA